MKPHSKRRFQTDPPAPPPVCAPPHRAPWRIDGVGERAGPHVNDQRRASGTATRVRRSAVREIHASDLHTGKTRTLHPQIHRCVAVRSHASSCRALRPPCTVHPNFSRRIMFSFKFSLRIRNEHWGELPNASPQAPGRVAIVHDVVCAWCAWGCLLCADGGSFRLKLEAPS